MTKTSERIIPQDFLQSKEAYLVYLRHLFAYNIIPQFLPKQGSILEAGCGEGYGTYALSQEGYSVVGLDIDKKVIDNASKKYDFQNCVFRWFDGTIFPFDDETFNAVVSFQVIEHVKDDIQFLAEIYRVLKTGGQCLLTTPNRLFRVRPHKKPWNRFHIREYTPDTFEQVLKKIFLDVRVWGIRGSDEIQEIEKVRIRQIQKFVDIDPFNLRKLLPPKYETLIAKWGKKFLKKKLKSAPQKNYLQLYGVEDYFIIKNHIEESLDLLAFWEK